MRETIVSSNLRRPTHLALLLALSLLLVLLQVVRRQTQLGLLLVFLACNPSAY